MIVEAEKSYSVLSISQKTRKAVGVVLVQVQKPENKSASGVSAILRAEGQCASSLCRVNSLLSTFLFYAGP